MEVGLGMETERKGSGKWDWWKSRPAVDMEQTNFMFGGSARELENEYCGTFPFGGYGTARTIRIRWKRDESLAERPP